MAKDIYVDQNFHGNRLLSADLTDLDPSLLPPDLVQGRIIAGDGIEIVDNGDGTVTISAKPAQLKVEAYRERFVVSDPVAEIPLLVTHGLGSTTVATTVLEVGGDGSRPVSAQVLVVDVNSVEVLLSGESPATFDILVVAGVDPADPSA
jgi:hypothetical protein